MVPRRALTAIVFVLKTGIGWQDLPKQMGCGSGMSCLRYLRQWQRAGVWDRLQALLIEELDREKRIHWERVVVDSSSVRAVFGGPRRDQIPSTEQRQDPSTT